MGKQYVRKGFEDKIKVNLARICGSGEDTFSFVRAEYVRDYTCELCEHQHLSMCFWVRNNRTNLIIKVGSECITHFRLPQSDIDKADALRKLLDRSIEEGRAMKVREFGKKLFDALPEEIKNKRYFYQSEVKDILGAEVYESIPKSDKKSAYIDRNGLIDSLGNEHFKALPRGEKFDLINNFYRLNYAERILDEVAKGDYLLSKEEIEQIVASSEDGADKLAAAEAKAKAKAEYEALRKLRSELEGEMYRASDAARKSLTDLDPAVIADWHARGSAIGIDATVERMVQSTADGIVREKAFRAEYGWLADYSGDNTFLLDLKRNLGWYRSLTPAQKEAGLKAYNAEMNPTTADGDEPDAGSMLDELIAKFPGNTFYRGLKSQWHHRHSLSAKQMDCVRKDYANKL